MSGPLLSSPKAFPSKLSSTKPCSTPTIHITTELPCIADKDLSDIPRPNYTPQDIARVQSILLNFVPVELADAIIDLAEYWPWVSVSRNSFTSAYSALEAPDHNAQWCYLVSPKVPSIERGGVCLPTEVKMVKFLIKTYESSYGKGGKSEKIDSKSQGYKTWFESMILKNGEHVSYDDDSRPNDWYSHMAAPHPMYLNDFREPDLVGEPVPNPLDEKKRWHVATNPQSSRDNDWHEITWKHNDIETSGIDEPACFGRGVGFIESLSVNDQVVLMARAMSPGWINTIFNVKIEIYYAFSSSYL